MLNRSHRAGDLWIVKNPLDGVQGGVAALSATLESIEFDFD
jgi:hypothetical protein